MNPMKSWTRLSLITVTLVLALALMPALAPAATVNPSSASAGYYLLPLHLSGQYTASTTAVAKWTMPYPCEINHAQATARASGGTSPTLSVVLKNGANTVSTMAVTAGTVTEGTLANTSVADEATITVDLTIGGTSPTWNDITVLVGCKRQ
ncbi:hypothetical protein [Candidatus Nitrospira bockiana]